VRFLYGTGSVANMRAPSTCIAAWHLVPDALKVPYLKRQRAPAKAVDEVILQILSLAVGCWRVLAQGERLHILTMVSECESRWV
jgi:hypothetical protein